MGFGEGVWRVLEAFEGYVGRTLLEGGWVEGWEGEREVEGCTCRGRRAQAWQAAGRGGGFRSDRLSMVTFSGPCDGPSHKRCQKNI